MPLVTASISKDIRQAKEPEQKVIVKYANDPIDSVGVILNLSDQGEEVTIMIFELLEQESFIRFATTLGKESGNIVKKEEDIDISQYDKFQPSDWLDLRGKNGRRFVSTDAINTLVLMNKRFITFHEGKPDGMSREPGVTRNFASVLKRDFPDLDEKFLETFAKKRTLRRLRAIQTAYADQQEETLRARTKKLHYSRY